MITCARCPRPLAALVVASTLLAASTSADARPGKWEVTSTAPVGGSATAVSCRSATSCTVVGYVTGSRRLPGFAASDADGMLGPVLSTPTAQAVTCRPVDCISVGASPWGLRAQRLTSSSWVRMSMPGPQPRYDAWLTGVACTSPASCYAAGDSDTNTDAGCGGFQFCDTALPVVEVWDGARWTPASNLVVPAVARTAIVASDAPYAVLHDVACESAAACVVVGEVWTSYPVSYGDPFADTGSRAGWTLDSLPTPASATRAQALAASCSARSCLAVGGATVAGHRVPLADSWSGGTWSAADAGLTVAGTLKSVSCERNACVAVGSSGRGAAQIPLVERWSAGRWQREHAAIPAGSRHRRGSALVGVSCASGSCEAVGNYLGSTRHGEPFGWFVERGPS